MNKQIHKFPLRFQTEPQSILMPKNAKIVKVAIQGTTICLWASVRPDVEKETRTFNIVPTGVWYDSDEQYLDSVLDGQFVWHIFEVI